MKKIVRFFAGHSEMRIEKKYAPDIINLCGKNKFIYRDAHFSGEYFVLRASLYTSKRMLAAADSQGLPLRVVRKYGFPTLFLRYRHRYGMLVGIFVFAAIIFFSGRVVWDVRVDGNRRLSVEEVKAQIERCGLKVGDAIGKINTKSVENRVIVYSDDISWISVNIIGTVAQVEIRESEVIEENPPEYAASDIIAARDGVIELYEDVRGNILLSIGDTVKAGDVIVSGAYGSEEEGFRYTSARGKVLARTERLLEVGIPLVYNKKEYTGKVFTEKYLVFFEKEIKIYGNSRNLHENCDTIEMVEYLDVLSGGELPVGIRTVKHHEYRYLVAERDEEEALELALHRLERMSASLAESAELISRSYESEVRDGVVSVRCKIRCIEDIAEIRGIEIDGLPRREGLAER